MGIFSNNSSTVTDAGSPGSRAGTPKSPARFMYALRMRLRGGAATPPPAVPGAQRVRDPAMSSSPSLLSGSDCCSALELTSTCTSSIVSRNLNCLREDPEWQLPPTSPNTQLRVASPLMSRHASNNSAPSQWATPPKSLTPIDADCSIGSNMREILKNPEWQL